MGGGICPWFPCISSLRLCIPWGTSFLGFRPTKLNCQTKEWQDRRLRLTFGSQAKTMSLHHHSRNLPLEKDQTNVPVAQMVPEEMTCKQQRKPCQQIPKGKPYHFNNNFGAGSSSDALVSIKNDHIHAAPCPATAAGEHHGPCRAHLVLQCRPPRRGPFSLIPSGDHVVQEAWLPLTVSLLAYQPRLFLLIPTSNPF